MAEAQNRNTNGTPNVAETKKRKGFWSNLFGKSSNEKSNDQEQKHKAGLMNSFMDHARQAAVREVGHVAEGEARKEIEALVNNNGNGSQPTTSTANVAPDTTTPSDALNASTSWAKRMVDNAQQKMQGLQSLGS